MKPSNILLFPTGAVAPEIATRPSLRTLETAARICGAIRDHGLADLAAAALAGVSAAELESWRREDPEFARRLAAAREEFRNARLLVIRQARNPDGSLDREAQAWLRKHGYEE